MMPKVQLLPDCEIEELPEMDFGTTTEKEWIQLLVTVFYTHVLGCVFCLVTVNP